jgi:GABA(A) receptor-associated protein
MSLKKNIDYTKTKFTDEEKSLIRKEVEIVRHKYPGHIPVVVVSKSKELKLSKSKYLVGSELTVSQFQFIIRKKLQNSLNSTEAMYLLARDNKTNNGVLLQSSALMSSVYTSHSDEETQMLFIEVCKENTFGN